MPAFSKTSTFAPASAAAAAAQTPVPPAPTIKTSVSFVQLIVEAEAFGESSLLHPPSIPTAASPNVEAAAPFRKSRRLIDFFAMFLSSCYFVILLSISKKEDSRNRSAVLFLFVRKFTINR